MTDTEKQEDLTIKIQAALDKAIQGVIAETKALNSYMVVADEKGNIRKIAAKDL